MSVRMVEEKWNKSTMLVFSHTETQDWRSAEGRTIEETARESY